MEYEVTLIEANIENAMKGEMRLGIELDGERKATVEYNWTDKHFNARFVGHAPSMPAPAHPITFLQKSIEAMQALKTEEHTFPTDVFKDHKVYFRVG